MAVPAPRVAVVGAGVSGLAAAHRLRTLLGPDARITVLEQRNRTGGVLRTVDLAGMPYDVGAEAFLARRPEVPRLLGELGLAGAQVHPTPAAPSVRAAGRTVPLPGGTLLGVPTHRSRLDGLLSAAGVAAVAAEPDRPLRWNAGADVALGGLLRARFGDELADRLADPLLGGVYAGRVDALGLRATVPALAAALDAGARSLTAAADAATPAPTGEPGPVFGALRGGYRVLLDALAGAAAAELRLGVTVRELARLPHGWRLTLGPANAPEPLDVDAVLLAVPAPATARLLAGVAAGPAAAAAEIELASSVVVALAYRAADAATLPPTSGALIATGEPLAVKGVTHSSTKWAHLGADGLVRLRASLGRYGEAGTLQVDDAELVDRVRADLGTLTGITADPVAVRVQRWGGGLPQYAPGHLDRVDRIERGLPAGLAVAGAALHGVGVPACIGTARAAAERLAAQLARDGTGRDGSMEAWPASTTPS
jgi:protoporphyrinogen/coproporphyrinogen III oxidase